MFFKKKPKHTLKKALLLMGCAISISSAALLALGGINGTEGIQASVVRTASTQEKTPDRKPCNPWQGCTGNVPLATNSNVNQNKAPLSTNSNVNQNTVLKKPAPTAEPIPKKPLIVPKPVIKPAPKPAPIVKPPQTVCYKKNGRTFCAQTR